MNRQNDHTLGEIISELLKEFHLIDKVREQSIHDVWPAVVGKMIAKHTTGIYLRNKKIYISLDNAALREELLYARTKLIKSLNKKLGEQSIEEIIFK